MNDPTEEIVKNAVLSGVKQKAEEARRLFIEFENRSTVPLWLPREEQPSYRVDAEKKTVTISLGYFEDVYGPYRGRYMLPPMQKVMPKTRYRLEITDPVLVEKTFDPDFQTYARARVALREFVHSRVRGQQDLDGYLEASCVIESSEFSLQEEQ